MYNIPCQSSASSIRGPWRECPVLGKDPSAGFPQHPQSLLFLAFQGFCSSLFHFSPASSVSPLLDVFCQHLNINLSLKKYIFSSWRDASLDSACLFSCQAICPLSSWPKFPQGYSRFTISSSLLFFHSLSRSTLLSLSPSPLNYC